MYGPHIDSLNIYVKTGGSMLKIWTRVGDNGNQWRYAQVDVSSKYAYQVNLFHYLKFNQRKTFDMDIYFYVRVEIYPKNIL